MYAFTVALKHLLVCFHCNCRKQGGRDIHVTDMLLIPLSVPVFVTVPGPRSFFLKFDSSNSQVSPCRDLVNRTQSRHSQRVRAAQLDIDNQLPPCLDHCCSLREPVLLAAPRYPEVLRATPGHLHSTCTPCTHVHGTSLSAACLASDSFAA